MSKRGANAINNLCSQMTQLLNKRIEILKKKGYNKNLIQEMIKNEKREVCSSSNGISKRPRRRRKLQKEVSKNEQENLTEQFEKKLGL